MNSRTFARGSFFLGIICVLFFAGTSFNTTLKVQGYNPGDVFKELKVENGSREFTNYTPSIVHFWSINDAKSRLANALLDQRFSHSDVEFYSVCIDGSSNEMSQCLNLDGIDLNNSSSHFLQMNDYRALKKDYGLNKTTKTFLLSRDGTIEKVYSRDEAWKLIASIR